MKTRVKICGITTPDAIEAAQAADYLGFIFFAASPRNLTPKQAAGLMRLTQLPTVAVMVDPSDHFIESLLQDITPDYIQLHGNEPPARVQHIRDHFRIPVIKAFPLCAKDDLAQVSAYGDAAEMFLFDAKAAKGLPGGNGITFDWNILAGGHFAKPWFLSGGLRADNVEEAVRISGARLLDVSSSLESAPGIKDPEMVRSFIQKVKGIAP